MLEQARDLYALTPEEFTAARNHLAKALKSDGRADEAAVVAKLRRPKLSEWALNSLATSQHDIVESLAAAIVEAQRAQAAAIGGDASGLRAATNELRRAAAVATDAAVQAVSANGGNGEGQRDEITAIVRGLIAAAEPAPLLAGVIGSEALVTSEDFFPGAPDPGPQRRPPAAAAAPQEPGTSRKSQAPQQVETMAEVVPIERASSRATSTAAAKQAMARAERLRLQQAAKAADESLKVATTAVTSANDELRRAKAALKEATVAAKAARAAVEAFDAETPPRRSTDA